MTPADRSELFLQALRRERDRTAARLLRRWPDLARSSPFAAAAAGDAGALAEMVAASPQLVNAPHERDRCVPLLYACASPLFADSPERARGILRCAELLLDAGASANSFMLHDPADPNSKIPALYFAAVKGNAPLVALLLARGADPNDGESIYHAAEMDRRDCLELLAAHGADLSGRHSHWGNTPLYFLAGWKEGGAKTATATAGMRWLLEHGADPNVTSYKTEETPLHRVAAFGRAPAVAAMLLDHGTAVDQPRADGKTAYTLAVRAGNVAVAELLRERGADVSQLTPVDELLGACMTGDEPKARALLAAHPGLIESFTGEDRDVFALAAEEGREAAVRLMHALGFDLRWEGHGGGTPLHRAAWHGHVGLAWLLIELGAPLDVRDSQYGCSPLAWAAHGSTWCRRADDDYCAIVAALLDAGAGRETSINRWGEPPETMARPRVKRLLRQRGFAPS